MNSEPVIWRGYAIPVSPRAMAYGALALLPALVGLLLRSWPLALVAGAASVALIGVTALLVHQIRRVFGSCAQQAARIDVLAAKMQGGDCLLQRCDAMEEAVRTLQDCTKVALDNLREQLVVQQTLLVRVWEDGLQAQDLSNARYLAQLDVAQVGELTDRVATLTETSAGIAKVIEILQTEIRQMDCRREERSQ